jgi:hypothetical protein
MMDMLSDNLNNLWVSKMALLQHISTQKMEDCDILLTTITDNKMKNIWHQIVEYNMLYRIALSFTPLLYNNGFVLNIT